MMNNFQQLEEQELRRSQGPSSHSYRNIVKSVNDMRFVGNVFDHFIPKVFRYFTVLLGGNSSMDTRTVSKKNYVHAKKKNPKTKKYPNL